MKIAVASGKGGTGKTTVSLNLAKAFDTEIQLLDCDVEEPNAHLFLQQTNVTTDTVSIPIPAVDEEICVGCGECGRFCEFNAIVSFGTTPLLFPELCHGCGGCIKICPHQVLSEVPHNIGTISRSQAGNIQLIEGKMNIGVAMAPPLIRAVKAALNPQQPAILDAPPGTSCPVIATLKDIDVVILVTEPTPFGLNDLKLAVDMIRELGLPFGVVVNRMGIGDDRVHTYCADEGIPILLEVPEDRRIAEAYSRGKLIVEALPEYRDLFVSLHNKAVQLSQQGQ